MRRPSIRQLECAVAVADRLHFGRAARACASPPPSRKIGLAWRPGAARGGECRLLGQTLAGELAKRRRRT